MVFNGLMHFQDCYITSDVALEELWRRLWPSTASLQTTEKYNPHQKQKLNINYLNY